MSDIEFRSPQEESNVSIESLTREQLIWRHVKSFRVTSGDRHRFPRFLFIPPEEVSTSILSKLSDSDIEALEKPFMRDKDKVFNVVYDRTSQYFGGPLEVIDEGPYLSFLEKDVSYD